MKKRKLLLDSSAAARAVIARLRADGHDLVTVAERGADTACGCAVDAPT